jgi:hypothetical protein
MFSTLGMRAMIANISVAAMGGLQLIGYYIIMPKAIMQNFKMTTLEEKKNLSEPVLVNYEGHKFIFKHRGGIKAAESLIYDTFDNSKLLKRAVFCQFLTSISITIGFAKQRRFMLPVTFLACFANCSLVFPIYSSAFNLMKLSKFVLAGDDHVWEDLNEARYAQRILEVFDPVYYNAKIFGMLGSLAVMIYCTPFLGVLVGGLGVGVSIDKLLQ